jgi:hypothetical protein
MARQEHLSSQVSSVLQQKARSGGGHPLPPGLRRAMEEALGFDFAHVRIHTTPELTALGAAAVAFGPDLHFAPGRYAPETFAGLFLLGHELAHVVQQQEGLASGAPAGGLLHESALEDAADQWGLRAALHAVGALVGPGRPSREAHGAASHPAAPVEARIAQAKLIIDDETWETGINPLTRWGFTQDQKTLYLFMLNTSERTFLFRDVDHMKTFVVRYEDLYKKNPGKFTNSKYDLFFEKVQTARPTGSITKYKAKWILPIEVRTVSGKTFEISVFVSVKRHLVSSFRENQFTERDRRIQNSLVRDDVLFERKLLEYAQLHADAIKANLMSFMYRPNLLVHGDAEMSFETDTTETPNTVYGDAENAIHCYPSHGTEVLILDQSEYHAMAEFLLWFFRTDERQNERAAYSRLSRISQHDKKTYELKEKGIDDLKNLTNTFAEQLKTHYAFPVNLAGTSSEALRVQSLKKVTELKSSAPSAPHFINLVMQGAGTLQELLIEVGELSAISSPMTSLKNKAAGLKAASVSTMSVGFKTHKGEVKIAAQALNDRPRFERLVEWVTQGHTATSASIISDRILNSNKKKADVTNQILAQKKDAKSALGKLSVNQKIEQFYDWYALAVVKGHLPNKLS